MQVLLHPSDQPVFRLAIHTAGCRLELRINDVPVFRDSSGVSLTVDLPVNEWLFQGSNDIQVLMSPLETGAAFAEHAQVEITLRHKFARDAVRNMIDIGKLRWRPEPEQAHAHHQEEATLQPDDEDATLLALPGQAEELTWRHGQPQTMTDKSVRICTSLLLPPPWPACPWQRSQPLQEDARTLFAVQGLVRAFHQRLQHGGYEDFLKLRRSALEIAYYLQPAEADEALGFPVLLRLREWSLQQLPEKGLKVEVAGAGRLVRLLNEQSCESPLLLVNETAGVAALLDAWWMFNGEWQMIR